MISTQLRFRDIEPVRQRSYNVGRLHQVDKPLHNAVSKYTSGQTMLDYGVVIFPDRWVLSYFGDFRQIVQISIAGDGKTAEMYVDGTNIPIALDHHITAIIDQIPGMMKVQRD